QEAISSPLLDNISVVGAAGVLINITGGMDLTIDEVTTIASIIQEASGEESEIIFGAVHDANLEGEVRVTVIATGLVPEGEEAEAMIRPAFAARKPAMAAVGGGAPLYAEATPFPRPPQRPLARQQLTDLDIPTFIRRQMD
ncbi:MAG TPA: hypothetical protein VJ957_11355, partial [Longimicrobiales bacterium]|nr:hypothetical protein [Longimicrobiales bacterium]